MKKLLILMLVFGLTSIASAAMDLQISVDGDLDPVDSEIWLTPSQEIKLDIWSSGYTGINDAMYWALVVDTSYGTITGGVVMSPPAPSMTTLDGPSALDVAFPCLEPGEDGPWGGIAGAYGETAGPGIYYDEFWLHCVAEGDAVVRLIGTTDFVSCVVLDTVVIHQIPEPASMLLLGLGGLLLRRRK